MAQPTGGDRTADQVPGASESSGETGHLPDDAIVIRGGTMKLNDLMTGVEVYEATYPGWYGLSFWSWPELTADAIARRVRTRRLPQTSMRLSTAARVRNITGTDGQLMLFVQTFDPGHYTLVLPSPPTVDDYERVTAAFDPPGRNPVARARARQRER